jgi:hypothetical protein
VRQVTGVRLQFENNRKEDAMLRVFRDSTGVEWRVWEVFPSKTSPFSSSDEMGRRSLMGSAFADGWLCFESPTEKRRLAPIPSGWEEVSARQMEELWRQATVVAPRAPRRASGPSTARAS